MVSYNFGKLLLSCLALFTLAGCASPQKDEAMVNLARADVQKYDPITRLAFVKTKEDQMQIAVIRHAPSVETVAAIETAAGRGDEKIIEH
jgi:uncharacterized lipoprotein YajG